MIDGTQAGTDSSASGTATLTLTDDESQLEYEITVVGPDLDGAQTRDPGDDVTELHIHNAPAGNNGALIFGLISLDHFRFGMTGTITILPSETPCEGDANGDGTVDPLDAGFVLARLRCPVGPAIRAATQRIKTARGRSILWTAVLSWRVSALARSHTRNAATERMVLKESVGGYESRRTFSCAGCHG